MCLVSFPRFGGFPHYLSAVDFWFGSLVTRKHFLNDVSLCVSELSFGATSAVLVGLSASAVQSCHPAWPTGHSAPQPTVIGY